LSLQFFELGHSGTVGPAYSLYPDIGASTYAATGAMIFLTFRPPRFSTEEGEFSWQTEMKFAVYGTPNSGHGFLKTSYELRKETLRIIGKFVWSEHLKSSASLLRSLWEARKSPVYDTRRNDSEHHSDHEQEQRPVQQTLMKYLDHAEEQAEKNSVPQIDQAFTRIVFHSNQFNK
jgi:hypothetical protein